MEAGGKPVLPDAVCLTILYPPACRRARPTTRSWAWSRRCARNTHPGREVVLVSKDINMRVKARALGLAAEDYQNDKVLEDGDLLYSGVLPLPADFWTQARARPIESWQQGQPHLLPHHRPHRGRACSSISSCLLRSRPASRNLYARVTEIRAKTAVLKTLKDYNHLKNAVWGVTTRNREQNFAMNLLMDPEVDFVTLDRQRPVPARRLMALASRPHPGARRPPLHRNHHDPRDGQRRRRHRLFARYRRRKNGPLDGRFGRQP